MDVVDQEPFEESSPSTYGDIMVEAVRPAVMGPDEIIAGYFIWDMDDFDNEISLLFRVKGFNTVERVCALRAEVLDMLNVDGDVWVLQRRSMIRAPKGDFSALERMPLPIRGKAFCQTADGGLLVVGAGVACFKGGGWQCFPVPEGVGDLTCVATAGGITYAGGKRNGDVSVVVRIEGNGTVSRVEIPFVGEINAIDVDAHGVLAIAGQKSVVQGSASRLVSGHIVNAPAHCGSTLHFQGKQYWGCVGDREAFGLFAGELGNSTRLSPRMAFNLTADRHHLYGCGEYSIFRFDGTRYETIKLSYDETMKQWGLAPSDSAESLY